MPSYPGTIRSSQHDRYPGVTRHRPLCRTDLYRGAHRPGTQGAGHLSAAAQPDVEGSRPRAVYDRAVADLPQGSGLDPGLPQLTESSWRNASSTTKSHISAISLVSPSSSSSLARSSALAAIDARHASRYLIL